MQVTKSAILSSTLSVAKAAQFMDTLSVVGNTTFHANVDVSGDLVIRGNLSVYQTRDTMTINTTINDYQLVVTEDISLNGVLKVSGNAVMGGFLEQW